MIKDLIESLETKLGTILLDGENKNLMTSIVEHLRSESERVLSDLKRTTDESVSRKNKLGLLSNTILDLQNQNRQMLVLRMLNLKLSKYRLSAINLKKNLVAKIKNLFDNKLSNQTNKDYQKYKNLSTQFNFEDDAELVLQKNLLIFKILLIAGTFDGDKQMFRNPVLPKSTTNEDKTNSGKSFL